MEVAVSSKFKTELSIVIWWGVRDKKLHAPMNLPLVSLG
jgi:hypothetical protein